MDVGVPAPPGRAVGWLGKAFRTHRIPVAGVGFDKLNLETVLIRTEPSGISCDAPGQGGEEGQKLLQKLKKKKKRGKKTHSNSPGSCKSPGVCNT